MGVVYNFIRHSPLVFDVRLKATPITLQAVLRYGTAWLIILYGEPFHFLPNYRENFTKNKEDLTIRADMS